MLVALIATSFSAMAEDIYIVAGSEDLCGTVWDGTDLNNKMTDNGDGTYSKTFTNVAVMNGYQFKVAKNGEEWYGDEAGNNITFNVTTACDVTITFNATTFKSTVTGTGVQAYVFNVEKVIAVGNGVGAWLNDAAWDPNADVNKMTEVADKVYEIAFDNVPVDEGYMVKFVTNGSWTDNFGGFFEASGILREISTYGVLTQKQIFGLYPQKDEQIKNLLSYLCKQKRLFLVDGFYSLTPELPKDRDRGLEAAVTVLADFMEQVEYHAAGEYPVKIIFLAGGEVYEILYAEPGKEAILNLLFARPEQEPPVRLVILEDAAQVDLLAIPNVRAYCLLDGDGNIQYLQEETEGSF